MLNFRGVWRAGVGGVWGGALASVSLSLSNIADGRTLLQGGSCSVSDSSHHHLPLQLPPKLPDGTSRVTVFLPTAH